MRLLEVDNRVVVPIHSLIRIVVSSRDVLHSWALPVFGIKGDASPGRLNLLYFSTPIRGAFYGQCSEICGANHSFIPIRVERVTPSLFSGWVRGAAG
jgi:heme/copper-type cytochrome/quinol oxidase subunit 2